MPSETGVEAFRRCLTAEGVEIDVIPVDATGRPRLDVALEEVDLDDDSVAEAIASCSPALGTGALDLSTDEILRALVVEELMAFSSCVRDMGVDEFPDPIPGFSGVGSAYSTAEIPYADPALPQALTTCRQRVLADIGGEQ